MTAYRYLTEMRWANSSAELDDLAFMSRTRIGPVIREFPSVGDESYLMPGSRIVGVRGERRTGVAIVEIAQLSAEPAEAVYVTPAAWAALKRKYPRDLKPVDAL